MKMVIAIDGPAASGKGTLAHRLGRRFDLAVLDTGLLYRFIGVAAHQAGLLPDDQGAVTDFARGRALHLASEQLNDPQLRTGIAGQYASVYSAIPGVRAALVDYQRNFACTPPLLSDGRQANGAVLDGRDIGTVICPDASLKFYITADLDVRAKRRLSDLQSRGFDAVYSDIFADLQERDARDMARLVSPTKPASDAFIIDTTHLSADEVFDHVVKHVEEYRS